MILVLAAMTLWGIGGVFIHELVRLGLEPVQVVCYSNLLTASVLLLGLAPFGRRFLLVPWQLAPGVLGLGLLGGAAAFVLWTTAVAEAGVGLAMLTNFTSPAWVTLLAWRLLGEPVDRRRLVALLAAFSGCALVARVYDPASFTLSAVGVAAGLGSGLCWGSYQVLGKRVLRDVHPVTVALYSSITGGLVLALGLSLFAPDLLTFRMPHNVLPVMALYVLGPGVLGLIAFTMGLRRMLAGVASLLGIWELLLAVGLGIVLLGERFDPPQTIGALLVVASVIGLRPTDEPAAPAVLSD